MSFILEKQRGYFSELPRYRPKTYYANEKPRFYRKQSINIRLGKFRNVKGIHFDTVSVVQRIRILEEHHPGIGKRREIARHRIEPYRGMVVRKGELYVLAASCLELHGTSPGNVGRVPKFTGSGYGLIAWIEYVYHRKDLKADKMKSTIQSMKIATRKAPVTHATNANES